MSETMACSLLSCGYEDDRVFEMDDYAGAIARWCPGCGDHAILAGVERLLAAEQLKPERTMFVSGIGCSSRFPHYLTTYGFHGIHGRALPLATGIKLVRPDLDVFVVMGDGDCCSIGAGHWIHAIRYNVNMVALLLDNNIYGLTKNQTSPTSALGRKTNTHPRGALLQPVNPVQTTLGVANVSFVARTVDWNPPHLFATLQAAHRHQGLSFVQILQRCPHYKAGVHDPLQSDPSQLLLMTHPEGIQLEDSIQKIFKNQQEHDPSDMDTARELAGGEGAIAIGLFYRDQLLDRYDQYTAAGIATSRDEKIAALNAELSSYQI